MTFEEQVAAFIKKAKENPERVARAVSIKLFSAVILGTPVDTGRLRMNWQASGATPALGQVSGSDKSGSGAIRSATQFVSSYPEWEQFSLSNNLLYAASVEFGGYNGGGPKTTPDGYSTQAPAGMVRVNVSRFQSLINQALRENT